MDERWIDITAMGDTYEVQMDISVNPSRYRHRPLHLYPDNKFKGVGEWQEGRPPEDPNK